MNLNGYYENWGTQSSGQILLWQLFIFDSNEKYTRLPLGLFGDVKFGGGLKSLSSKISILSFFQMNMDLCLQMVNAYLYAAGNTAQKGAFKCLEQT